MICPTCGTQNPPGAKFCTECAARLAASCPACGTENPPGAKFCFECATPLGAPSSFAASASRSTGRSTDAPVAERRLVTVLFADLVGFTPFAEERDAEDVRETLTRYFDIARDTIERYGGTIEKFIGDAVMAVWGAPVAREDDAERAVRAGLDLLDAVRELGDGLSARAGILTGEAAVTLGATGQGMVAGDIVNTASRLQTTAEPGTVLVGEATMRAASAAVAFEDAGAASMKGKALPVPAYRALRVVAERGGRNRAGSLEAPFVGRDEELRVLKEGYHATSREGRARLVSIVGPAGIGKSRLAWEYAKYGDGLVEQYWWHTGRSPAYGEGLTFWALGEMIRRRAGLAENDDEPTTRSKIAEMLATHLPDEAERRWIEPAMLGLLGLGGASLASEQLFAAWRTFFERMAAVSPVVLVFEDLHWSDSGLLDFIDHLLEWSRDHPIYIVTLARPELLEKRPNWGAGKRQFTSLFLEPLPEVAMRQLLTGLVPGLPDSATRAIVARADGVPLYAVETIRMLVAEGRLVEADGAYVPAGDLTDLAIPETLTALIAARLDGLDPVDRALLQDAAVLGQTFTIESLAAINGRDPSDLEERMPGMARRELVALRADPQSPERGQYGFVQSLIREVAYNTLARKDRKVRHLAAARHFESLPTDELAPALAGHYLAAYENAGAGAEADALAAQARVALRAAAERATSLGAPEQAARFLRQALAVSSDPAEQATLAGRAGLAGSEAGHHEAAEEDLTRACELYRRLGDRAAAARATTGLGQVLLNAGRVERARTLLEAAADEFADLVDTEAGVALGGQLARAHFFSKQPEQAIAVADRVLAAAERADLGAIIADTLVTKGTCLTMLGRGREGLALIKAGGELAEALNLPHAILRSRINRATTEVPMDPHAGLESLRAGMLLARQLGMRSYRAALLTNAGWAARVTGEWDWAERELEQALSDELEGPDRAILVPEAMRFAVLRGREAEERIAVVRAMDGPTEDVQTEADVCDALALVELVDGHHAEARRRWRRAAGVTSGGMALPSLAEAARVALWDGDPEGAAADLSALDAIGLHGAAVDADREVIRAGIAALTGNAKDAVDRYRQALGAYRDLGLPWPEALAGITMARTLPLTLPEVAEAVDNARRILSDLGAAPFLRILDEAVQPGARSVMSEESVRSAVD